MSTISSVSHERLPSRLGRSARTRGASVAACTVALLLASAGTSAAQTSPRLAPRWEVRVPSGALVSTGTQRDIIKDAALSAVQLSYVLHPQLAVTATLGWARSRDLASVGRPKVDAFSYDLGAEARAPGWHAGDRLTVSPFAGAGVGARSYNYRARDVDATHNAAAYGSVGSDAAVGRVRLRLELRDYVAGFKPLGGTGASSTHNDVVALVGISVARHAAQAPR
jgi:hypothetical protein